MGHAAVLALALLCAGCGGWTLSGRSDTPAATSSSPSFGDRISNFFGSPKTQMQTQGATPEATQLQDIDCPTVEIRTGASTFAISAAGSDATPLSLRYQGSFGQTARECKLVGSTVTMKVGVEGRVVLGPAGGPGKIDLPIRYAVVREGPEPLTITTKIDWLSVDIGPEDTSVPFSQIESDLTFPMPRGNEIEAYVVYVGFDRAVVKVPEKKTPAKKPPVRKRTG